jgi:hypothetical protein
LKALSKSVTNNRMLLNFIYAVLYKKATAEGNGCLILFILNNSYRLQGLNVCTSSLVTISPLQVAGAQRPDLR